jgi:putative transposase
LPRVDRERRETTVVRLRQLQGCGELTAVHVRLAASGSGVSERTVWRWLAEGEEPVPVLGRPRYELSEADVDAFVHYRGNIAGVHRARMAVAAGSATAAGVPVPQFLCEGWAQAGPVGLRTLQSAFGREMTPGERAAWRKGEEGWREADVYQRRRQGPRNRVWEMDHKDLPILVLPPRGPAVRPWLTTVVDDGTRAGGVGDRVDPARRDGADGDPDGAGV